MEEREACLERLIEAKKDCSEFFGCDKEINGLLSFFKASDPGIALVLGPRHTGKTALLKRIQSLWDESEYNYLKRYLPIFYFDICCVRFCIPGLIRDVATWAKWVTDNGDDEGMEFEKVVASSECSLAGWLRCLEKIAPENAQVKPIILLDEIYDMKDWSEPDLKALSAFMKKMDKRAYMVMSTVNEIFLCSEWLKRYLDVSRECPLISLDYYGEDEARAYFSSRLRYYSDQPYARGKTPHEVVWDNMYGVFGGNPGALAACAYATAMGSEYETVADVINERLGLGNAVVVKGLMFARKGFRRESYRKVAELICSGDGAASFGEVKAKAFDGNGRECDSQLEAMVRDLHFHVRFAPVGVSCGDITSMVPELVRVGIPASLGSMKDVLEEYAKVLSSKTRAGNAVGA